MGGTEQQIVFKNSNERTELNRECCENGG